MTTTETRKDTVLGQLRRGNRFLDGGHVAIVESNEPMHSGQMLLAYRHEDTETVRTYQDSRHAPMTLLVVPTPPTRTVTFNATVTVDAALVGNWTHAEAMQFVQQRLERLLADDQELGTVATVDVRVGGVCGSSQVQA